MAETFTLKNKTSETCSFAVPTGKPRSKKAWVRMKTATANQASSPQRTRGFISSSTRSFTLLLSHSLSRQSMLISSWRNLILQAVNSWVREQTRTSQSRLLQRDPLRLLKSTFPPLLLRRWYLETVHLLRMPSLLPTWLSLQWAHRDTLTSQCSKESSLSRSEYIEIQWFLCIL